MIWALILLTCFVCAMASLWGANVSLQTARRQQEHDNEQWDKVVEWMELANEDIDRCQKNIKLLASYEASSAGQNSNSNHTDTNDG